MTQPIRPDPNMPQDEVIRRYHAAQTQLDADPHSYSPASHAAGPSAHVHANVLAYAAQLAGARSAEDSPLEARLETVDLSNNPNLIANYSISTSEKGENNHLKPASNDSQWKIRALASIAILGLSGLLFMQWDRAPAEDQEIAFGSARPAPSAAGTGTAAPAPAPAVPVVPSPSDKLAVAKPSVKPAAPRPAPNSALTESAAGNTHHSDVASKAEAPERSADRSAGTELAKDSASYEAEADNNKAAGKSSRSLNSQAPSGSTSESSNAAMFAAIRSKDTAALALALQNGADKNAKSKGTPALTLCVQIGQLNMVRQLLDAGADVNALDAQGVSPLAYARRRGFAEMATVLEAGGAR